LSYQAHWELVIKLFRGIENLHNSKLMSYIPDIVHQEN